MLETQDKSMTIGERDHLAEPLPTPRPPGSEAFVALPAPQDDEPEATSSSPEPEIIKPTCPLKILVRRFVQTEKAAQTATDSDTKNRLQTEAAQTEAQIIFRIQEHENQHPPIPSRGSVSKQINRFANIAKAARNQNRPIAPKEISLTIDNATQTEADMVKDDKDMAGTREYIFAQMLNATEGVSNATQVADRIFRALSSAPEEPSPPSPEPPAPPPSPSPKPSAPPPSPSPKSPPKLSSSPEPAPSTPTGKAPSPPEEKKTPSSETPIAELNFLTTHRQINQLRRAQSQGSLSDEDRARLQALEHHQAQLIQNTQDTEAMTAVNDHLQTFRARFGGLNDAAADGSLRTIQLDTVIRDLDTAIDYAGRAPDELAEELGEKYRGLQRHLHLRRLREVRNQVESLRLQASPEPPVVDLEKFYGPPLSPETQYQSFLARERAKGSPYQIITGQEPAFYRAMTETEKNCLNIRIEILNAAAYKTTKSNLKDFAATENPLNGITKSEVEYLYNDMPGFRLALEQYAQFIFGKTTLNLLDKSGQLTPRTIFQINDRNQLEIFKNEVESQVALAINPTEPNDAKTRLQAVAAQQAAFNLMFATNAFESADINCESPPSLHNETFSVPLRTAMIPLHAAIRSGANGIEVGNFGPWIVERMKAVKTKIAKKPIDIVEVIPRDDQKSVKLWWTTYRTPEGELVLRVPPAYPEKTIGSLWEEIKIENQHQEKPLASYLADGETIPWNKLGQGLGGAYTYKAGYAHTLWMYSKGDKDTQINVGRIKETILLWSKDIFDAFQTLKIKDPTLRGRWIVYASLGGPNRTQKLPKTTKRNNSQKRIIASSLAQTARFFSHSHEAFFSWDQASSVINPF